MCPRSDSSALLCAIAAGSLGCRLDGDRGPVHRRLRRMPPELRSIDSVLAEEVVERRARDSEKLRGARKIPLGDRERLSHRLRLGALPCDAQVEVLGVVTRILEAQIAR